MLVRAARRQPRPRDLRRLAPPHARGLIVLAAGLMIASCTGRATTAADLSWTISPQSAAVGPATLTMTLRDRAGAVTGARLRLEGHMSHPGMTPVVADAVERTPGVYVASFTFTMAGDWVLVVSATLPDGGRVERRIEVANVRP